MTNSLFSLNRQRDGARPEDPRGSAAADADGRAAVTDERAAAREHARERAERAAREQQRHEPSLVHGADDPARKDAVERDKAERHDAERSRREPAQASAVREAERASRDAAATSPKTQREPHEQASGGADVLQPDGSRALGTSHLGTNADKSWQRWREIQGDFVDQPRRAVSDAHALVGEVLDGIIRQFEQERGQLEQRWSRGEDVSTEDLRRCLQTYRDFFGRLLANVETKPS